MVGPECIDGKKIYGRRALTADNRDDRKKQQERAAAHGGAEADAASVVVGAGAGLWVRLEGRVDLDGRIELADDRVQDT